MTRLSFKDRIDHNFIALRKAKIDNFSKQKLQNIFCKQSKITVIMHFLCVVLQGVLYDKLIF